MATERWVLCGGAAAPPGKPPAPPIRLDRYRAPRNVRLQLDGVRRTLWADFPPEVWDLLDIAAYVTAADQAVTRADGGRVVGGELGAGWRRAFRFRIAVREPDRWSAEPVCRALTSALSFLSDDEYAFEFERLPRNPNPTERITFDHTPFDGEVAEVLAFSGGLDSLAGAAEAVAAGRQVLLVNHRSTSKLVARYERLVEQLCARAGTRPPLHFPVWANRAAAVGKEYTQRTRSFLVAALGCAFARMVGLDTFRFYENGVTGLNLPPSPQVLGARATRTTHPKVLAGFTQLFTAVLGAPFAVENPYRWDTKADVVRRIARAGCAGLIAESRSCAQTIALKSTKHGHCGTCSQCIDRRFAVLAAGLAAHDPASDYAVDLLVGDRGPGDPRAQLAGYLALVDRVNEMGPSAFLSHFGELARAVPHMGPSASAAVTDAHALYRRHAREVLGVIEAAIAEHIRGLRRRQLPDGCLLRIAYDEGAGAAPAPESALADHAFVKRGDCWQVRYAGGTPFTLTATKGAAYLSLLLARPHEAVSAAQLACAVAGCPDRFALGSAGEEVDEDALAAYRARAAELAADIDRARRENDTVTADVSQRELDALLEQLGRASGAGGRVRKAAGDDAERTRKAVCNALTRAVKAIFKYNRPLAAHLSGPRLAFGMHPSYRPDTPIVWEA